MKTLIAFVGLAMLPWCIGCVRNGTSSGPELSYEESVRQRDEQMKEADEHLLFVGNSHTHFHDLPTIVCRMLESLLPKTTFGAKTQGAAFLDQIAADPEFQQLLTSRKWKFVILQAQKISSSGQYKYSTQEGIDIAKKARENGASVFFFSEWGRRGVPNEGETTHAIYAEMAEESGTDVIPVGKAWDIALSQRPEMVLHAPDGNHQSATGAFLTACVIAGALSGEDSTKLAAFEYNDLSADDRKFLADAAAKALRKGDASSDDSKGKRK
jgi:hypothetical protein